MSTNVSIDSMRQRLDNGDNYFSMDRRTLSLRNIVNMGIVYSLFILLFDWRQ